MDLSSIILYWWRRGEWSGVFHQKFKTMLSTAPSCSPRSLGKISPSPYTNGFKPRPKTQIQFLPNKPSLIIYPPASVPVPLLPPFQNPTQTVLQRIDTCLSLISGSRHGGGEWRKEKVASDVVGSEVKQIHAQILKLGLVNSVIGNKLAVLYLKVGMEESAVNLFVEISTREIQVYATLIGYYGKLGQWEDVISVFVLMVEDGFRPDKFLLPKIIKACSELEELTMGVSIHGYVLKEIELSLDVFVGNSLIDMYAKCRDLNSSIKIFDNMQQKDVISWTTLVTAHSNAGLMDDASRIFESMQAHGIAPDLICWNALLSGFSRNGCVNAAFSLLEDMKQNGPNPGINSWNGVISGCVQNGLLGDALNVFVDMLGNIQAPDGITVASILPACSGLQKLNLGKELHAYAIKHGFAENAYVGGSLIDMYFKCGKSNSAEIVFSNLKDKKTLTIWNEMIAAYTDQGRMSMVSELLQLMEKDGSPPNIITYNTILSAHARNGDKDQAFAQFREMARLGLKPNIISLNSLIAGFQQCGLKIEALELVRIMQLPPPVEQSNCDQPRPQSIFPDNILNTVIHPNVFTISSALSASADLKLKNQGKEIHGYILRNYLESNIFVSSTLVDLYSKCVDITSATKVFRQISDTSMVTWNILMSGFNYNGKPESALRLFPEMLEQGISPSLVTMVILLSTCSAICALNLGRGLHSYIAKNIISDNESSVAAVTVQTSLINMYAECGSVVDAKMVFEKYSHSKDLGLWNSMISCYSLHGMASDALYLFDKMEELGIKPDHITFTAILSVCNHQGLMEVGRRFFNSMEYVYAIHPTLEHFTCMVGILGDAGLIEEALELVRNMPFEPDSCVWATLLRSCRIHFNHVIGQIAAGKLFQLEPTNTSNYIILSNIYAMAGMWEASRDVWISMRGRGLKIATAHTLINIGSTIHVFKAGEKRHPGLRKILETCDELNYKMEQTAGFVPQEVIFDDDEEVDEIDPFGCFHSEKLAICCGVMSSKMPIRVSKSARMCIDCHTWSKFVSKIEEREVFVRDGCFYHHFINGVCSCKDKW